MTLRNVTKVVLTPEQWKEMEREDRRVARLVCQRPAGDPPPLCPCNMRSVKRCQHRLSGSRDGEVCGAPLCQKCAYPQGRGLADGVCPAHAPQIDTWDPTKVPRRTS